MKILLDTNFVITCTKQKIDFENLAEQIIDEKIEWLIPQDVLDELKDKKSGELSLEIIKRLKPKVINLPGKNPNVDMKIAKYLKGKKIVLATLDKALKKKVSNKILIIRGKKKLEIV